MTQVLTFGDLEPVLRRLEIHRVRCGRSRRLELAALVAWHGREAGVPELRRELAADCPRREAALAARCDLWFPQLPALGR